MFSLGTFSKIKDMGGVILCLFYTFALVSE